MHHTETTDQQSSQGVHEDMNQISSNTRHKTLDTWTDQVHHLLTDAIETNIIPFCTSHLLQSLSCNSILQPIMDFRNQQLVSVHIITSTISPSLHITTIHPQPHKLLFLEELCAHVTIWSPGLHYISCMLYRQRETLVASYFACYNRQRETLVAKPVVLCAIVPINLILHVCCKRVNCQTQ